MSRRQKNTCFQFRRKERSGKNQFGSVKDTVDVGPQNPFQSSPCMLSSLAEAKTETNKQKPTFSEPSDDDVTQDVNRNVVWDFQENHLHLDGLDRREALSALPLSHFFFC